MQQDELIGLFSATRLASYRKDGEGSAQGFTRYQWNLRLSEAMLPALHYLEILLRNRVDKVIARHYGADWLLRLPPALRLTEEDRDRITRHAQRFRRERGRNATHHDMLAQMTFGFWCAFFHKRYDPLLWHRKHALATVFPDLLRAHCTRRYIEPRLQQVKELRNRIAHHEPVWNRSPSIADTHALCHELIAAIAPDALAKLEEIDRFPGVYAQALAAGILQKLPA